MEVPPPTRGWTLFAGHKSSPVDGFPAHAGMDPGVTTMEKRHERFPRPRGDGPFSQRFRRPPRPVSPPTRGWTHHHPCQPLGQRGFPAHAGMDPRHRREHVAAEGFPRPRGDGPVTWYQPSIRVTVSPPTRGWDRAVGLMRCATCRFPPPTRGWTTRRMTRHGSYSGFPAPRGDGPPQWWQSFMASMVSPPTRGWTRPVRGVRGGHAGFPAHAGMDPAAPPRLSRPRRFPRPRGDGPVPPPPPPPPDPVSPPTRGWTLHRPHDPTD